MRIDARIVSANPYFEIAINDGKNTIVHGILNKEYSLELAEALVSVAGDLCKRTGDDVKEE